MYAKRNISHVQKYITCSIENERLQKKAYVSKNEKDKNEKDKSRNTTPVLDMKTLASQSTSRVVIVISGATPGARIEMGKEWRDVTGGGNQGRRNGSRSTRDDRRCVGDGDNYRNVVMGCLRETNHRADWFQ